MKTDTEAREYLANNPDALKLRVARDGSYLYQVVDDNSKILAEGRYKTKAAREAGIEEFRSGAAPEKPKEKLPPIDVSLVHYTSENSHVEAGGVNSGAAQFIERLPSMNSRDLMKVVEGTVNAERVTFVMRGAAAFELVKRKLAEGACFNKTNGSGVDTICNELAKEVGIDGKTLYKDYKVFEEFGDRLIANLKETPERILPREMYVIATNTDTGLNNPGDVLDYFEEQREVTGGYFTDHARRDIKRVNEGMMITEIRIADGVERLEKIKEAKGHDLPVTEKMVSVQIPASEESNYYLQQIIEKHARFAAWFTLRCQEEFGDLPKGKK